MYKTHDADFLLFKLLHVCFSLHETAKVCRSKDLHWAKAKMHVYTAQQLIATLGLFV